MILRILIAALFLLSGCDRLTQLQQQSEIIQKQQTEIEALKGKIDDLGKSLSDVQLNQNALKSNYQQLHQNISDLAIKDDERISNLLLDYTSLRFKIVKNESVIFTPNSMGFQRLDTGLGHFLILIRGVTPYLDGHRLTLNIGNPSLSEFPGFILKVKWGEVFNPKNKITHTDWEKSLRSKEERFSDTLRPGRWNKIDLILAPTKIEQLEYIEIQMEVNEVILSGNRDLR